MGKQIYYSKLIIVSLRLTTKFVKINQNRLCITNFMSSI